MKSRARLGLVLATLVAGPIGCQDREPEGRPAFGPPPCDVESFPCTWDEVPPEIVERTDVLGEVAGLYGASGVPLDSVASFLAAQAEVATAVVAGTGVRFRLEGGRPAWVYPADELTHHRRPAGDSAAAADGQAGRLSLPSRRRMQASVFQLDELRNGLLAWLAPSPLAAAVQAQGEEQGVAADEPGEGKKALILSPFEWEFPGTGVGYARRASVIRDYQERNGGDVVYHGDVAEFEDNPADAGDDARLLDGTRLLAGEVQFDDFLGWKEEKYNLILIATHGTYHRCDAPPPVGGAKGATTTRGDVEEENRCPLIWAGRARQESYGSYRGVEVLTYVKELHEPHQGLTSTEAADCARRASKREEEGASEEDQLRTSGGKPCTVSDEREKRLVGLWTPFFQEQYPDGLENVILFMGACRSGTNNVLLEHFAQDGNEHVVVLGFDAVVSGADGYEVGNKLLELLDKGYHSREMIERLKKLDRTKHLVGRALAPGDEALPARPAEITDAATQPTHGRDVVELRDPAAGRELEEGDIVRVVGTPGDGKADSLDIRATLVGVSEPSSLEQVRLRVSVVGGPKPEAGVIPRAPTAREGAYEYDGPVALGRDAREGEVVDLEIEGELPGGGLTRWRYENIHLASSFITFSVSGDAGGSQKAGLGVWGVLGTDRSRHAALEPGYCSVRIWSDEQTRSPLPSINFSGMVRDGLRSEDYLVGDDQTITSWGDERRSPGVFFAGLGSSDEGGEVVKVKNFVSQGGTLSIQIDGDRIKGTFSVQFKEQAPFFDYPRQQMAHARGHFEGVLKKEGFSYACPLPDDQ